MKRFALLLLAFWATGFDYFRLNRPVPSSDVVIRMPQLERQILPSGVQLIVHSDAYLPLFHIRVQFLSGLAVEPANQRGALRLLFRTLVSENRALLSALDELGATPSLAVDEDAVSVAVQVRAEDATSAISAVLRALVEPKWDEAELKNAQQSLYRELATKTQSPHAAARLALNRILFPKDHPLCRNPKDEAAEVKKRNLEELKVLHRSFVVSRNLAIAIAGRIAPPVAAVWVKKSLTGLPEGDVPQPVLPIPKPEKRTASYVVPYPGLVQSVIFIGRRAPSDGHVDAPALEMAAGWVSTNVGQQLREEKTVTYGASAHYQKSAQSGVFVVTAAVEAQHTGYAAREVLSQIFAATSDTVNSKLLPMYRAHMVRDITEESASLAGIGALSEGIFRYGPDHWQKRIAKTQTVSHPEVYKALRDYVVPDTLEVVIAGDPAVIEPQLKKEGLGPVRILGTP